MGSQSEYAFKIHVFIIYITCRNTDVITVIHLLVMATWYNSVSLVCLWLQMPDFHIMYTYIYISGIYIYIHIRIQLLKASQHNSPTANHTPGNKWRTSEFVPKQGQISVENKQACRPWRNMGNDAASQHYKEWESSTRSTQDTSDAVAQAKQRQNGRSLKREVWRGR